MESFYGGRIGASFVIVKQFDCINQEEDAYKGTYLAKDASSSPDSPIYLLDENDKFIERNSSNYTSYVWEPTILNGATVNAKKRDESSTTKVLPKEKTQGMVQCFKEGGSTVDQVNYGEYVIIDTTSKDNPDNGKIFRRTMDYTNELGGAEYVGQVVGPRGSASELKIGSYTTEAGTGIGEYVFDLENPDDGGLVPGKTDDGYNDTIKYCWQNFRDKFGNITNTLIGFKIPFLVAEITGSQRSPYGNDGIIIPDNTELFVPNGEEGGAADPDPTHGWTGHPFYRKWKLTIPKGVQGSSLYDVTIYPTTARAGQSYYKKTNTGYSKVGNLTEDINFPWKDSEEPVGPDSQHQDPKTKLNIYEYKQQVEDIAKGYFLYNTKYYRINECDKFFIGCYIVKYDTYEVGEWGWINLGPFNQIRKTWLTEDGKIHIDYTSSSDQVINEEEPLKWISNIGIDTKGIADEEGQGDQKLYYKWNTSNDIEKIGEPLNYIIDTVTYIPKEGYEDYNYAYHLLVYFSDPAYRDAHKCNAKYPSVKLNKDIEEWVDLGYIKGEGSLHVIKKIDNLSELEGKTPEQIAETIPGYNPEDFAGWGVTYENNGIIEFYFYDYKIGTWYSVGSLDGMLLDASRIVSVGNSEPTLNQGGIWFKTVERTVAYVNEG